MSFRLVLVALFVSLLLAVTPAMATVINFDNLPTPNAWLGYNNAWGDFGPPYAGLSWTGWEVMNRPAYQALYHDATLLPSASNFAYPGLDTSTLTVSSLGGIPFNFLGAQFAYWPNIGGYAANSVTVRGYLGANLVGTVSTGQLSTVWAGSDGINGAIDQLVFSTNPGSGYFRMDNFGYAPVPEPLSSFMIGGGLLLLGGLLKWGRRGAA